MKHKFSINQLILVLVTVLSILSSCNNDIEKDGLILIDPNTGKLYLLQHSIGDAYFINERKMLIIGEDTTWLFSK